LDIGRHAQGFIDYS